jgi:AraC family transcriptional regulator of adaptative response/methylated-DNA-[protein]-cysteine methyltransferase
LEKKITYLTSSRIETPLGTMMAIADDTQLYFLDFIERKKYDQKIQKLHIAYDADITPGTNNIITLLQQELADYFAGKLQNFTVATRLSGSVFQNNAWKALTTIPYGKTINYGEQAVIIGNKKATRAVATANSNNTLAIIIPCHRVIGSNGSMRGYASGIDRKEWLIEHERLNRHSN